MLLRLVLGATGCASDLVARFMQEMHWRSQWHPLMYEAHWQLDEPPFDDRLDARFYWPSASHHGAILKLRYVVETAKPLGLLVGEHGLGKSFLTHVVEAQLANPAVHFVRLTFPTLAPDEVLRYLATELGALATSDPVESPADIVLTRLQAKLRSLAAAGEQVVLVVDEAHLLESAHLLRLQLLLNVAAETNFSLLLVGRSDLLPKVRRVQSLDARVAVRTTVEPLSPEETGQYLTHRLQTAGCTVPLFNPAAVRAVWELSRGVPRRLNQLCDLALLVGFADGRDQLTRVEVTAAAEELCAVSFD
jgi:type II secretory pathway predicted ATPase ExeA